MILDGRVFERRGGPRDCNYGGRKRQPKASFPQHRIPPLAFENSRRKVCPNSGFETDAPARENGGVDAPYAKILRSHSESNLNFRPGASREGSLQESRLRGAFAAESKRDTRRAGACSPTWNKFQDLFQFPFRFLH